ncbi:MAG: uracil-DNA glycosylase [Rhizobiaceae bacterium]|nr:uracil-DNA glycosylase [Rhizobiaceae bacterium]
MVRLLTRNELRDILAFYQEAGVDDALVDEAPDRLLSAQALANPRAAAVEARADSVARQTVVPNAPPPSSSVSSVPSSTIGPDEQRLYDAVPDRPMSVAAVPDEGQVMLARELAQKARTLDELREHLANFDGCNLKYTAKNLVFSDGNPEADLMLVGEAPGRDEDIEGLPFVGRSGRLLDQMLAAIGIDRQSAYIANVIPWRPPGNRTPTPQETEICRPFIERQIELAKPKVLLTLGGPSSKVLLKTTDGVLRMRGKWRNHVTAGGVSIPAMPTLHPAYLLRTPAHKKLAWRDLLEVKVKLASLREMIERVRRGS